MIDTGDSVSLRFKTPPDHEYPTDDNKDNEYNVTVEVGDGEATTTRDVVVTVEDVDEPGVVRLSTVQPEDSTAITARLSDPDGVVAGTVEWQWAIEDPPDNNPISGATSDTYVPVTSDVDNTVIAIATYTDGFGEERTAQQPSANNVLDQDDMNVPPAFPIIVSSPVVDRDQTRYIVEKTGTAPPQYVVANEDGETRAAPVSGDAVSGDAVVAEDTENGDADKLTYTLSGADAVFFSIDTDDGIDAITDGDVDTNPGQIRLKPDTVIDHETQDSYTVTVTATDPSGASDSITLTIEVVNVDEAPVVQEVEQLRVSCDKIEVPFEENQTGNVATCTASDPDGGTPTWSRSGPDSSVFSISSNGVLSIDSQLDYEPHSDANGDNVYEVTVTATTPDMSRNQDIEVTLVNVDEPGTVSISPAQPPYRVGDVLSASLSDGDDEETVTGWQWARSTTAGGTFASISGATNDTYDDCRGGRRQLLAGYGDLRSARSPGLRGG